MASPASKPRVRVLLRHSSSAADAPLVAELLRQVRILESFRNIDIWDDTRVEPGSNLREEIQNAIAEADVVLLVLSPDMFSSDCLEHLDLPHILRRVGSDGLVLVPIVLRSCFWRAEPSIASLSALPRDGRAIASLTPSERDDAIAEITQELDAIVSRRWSSEVVAPPPTLRTPFSQLTDPAGVATRVVNAVTRASSSTPPPTLPPSSTPHSARVQNLDESAIANIEIARIRAQMLVRCFVVAAAGGVFIAILGTAAILATAVLVLLVTLPSVRSMFAAAKTAAVPSSTSSAALVATGGGPPSSAGGALMSTVPVKVGSIFALPGVGGKLAFVAALSVGLGAATATGTALITRSMAPRKLISSPVSVHLNAPVETSTTSAFIDDAPLVMSISVLSEDDSPTNYNDGVEAGTGQRSSLHQFTTLAGAAEFLVEDAQKCAQHAGRGQGTIVMSLSDNGIVRSANVSPYEGTGFADCVRRILSDIQVNDGGKARRVTLGFEILGRGHLP